MAVPIQAAGLYLEAYRIASITAYNRLESSPRTANFDRSLKAEIRDPLWMLTRQWQFGEFKGEDAATAVTTQIEAGVELMDQVHFPGNNTFPYRDKFPLETTVERETLSASLFLAVQMGRYFIRLLKKPLLPSYADLFQLLMERYPLDYTPDLNDQEGNQLLIAVKDKMPDGYLLYRDIVTPESGSTVFENWLTATAPAASDQILERADAFKAWYQRNYSQPATGIGTAWIPSKLEYEFAVSSSAAQQESKILVADQYHDGHLDWYAFDLDRKINTDQPIPSIPAERSGKTVLKSYLPSPVVFKGMPNPRYWMMEETQTDFGSIDTSATGLLHLMLAEFGLTCSNDWFMLPYEMSVNSLCEMKKIIVKDVFGQYTLIRAAGRGAETNWQRWSMFTHTELNNKIAGANIFYLAPAITKLQEAEPLEEVNFLRDEMANMVWAVENIVPSAAGKGVSGKEMAMDNEERPAFVSEAGAKIRYVLGTLVPENWIPFIPVQMQGSISEIRLQRAALPAAKGALGVLLTEQAAPYYVDEEQVRRSGILVRRLFQRTRWHNGETCLWLGRQKEAGKGEGWSNLKFDQIEDIP